MQIIFVFQNIVLSTITQISFGTIFGSLEWLAAHIWAMLFVYHLKFSSIVLLFLMFSLLFMNMQIRQFVYHTIG